MRVFTCVLAFRQQGGRREGGKGGGIINPPQKVLITSDQGSTDFRPLEAPWGHFWSPLDALFVSKNSLEHQRWPKSRPRGATPDISSTFWTPFWSLPGVFLRFENRLFFWCHSGAPFGSSWEAQWPRSAVNSSKNQGRACCVKVHC